jgi:hypothetical protein
VIQIIKKEKFTISISCRKEGIFPNIDGTIDDEGSTAEVST